jgi:hypothetical protein
MRGGGGVTTHAWSKPLHSPPNVRMAPAMSLSEGRAPELLAGQVLLSYSRFGGRGDSALYGLGLSS